MNRILTLVWRGSIVFGTVLLVGCAIAGAANASPPPACPTAPAVDDLSDPVVHELRMIRIENASTCDALAGAAANTNASLGDDLWGGMSGKLDMLHSDLTPEGGLSVHDAGAADPGATQTVHLSAEDQDWLKANQGALASQLWFLVGLGAAAMFGMHLLRLVL